MKYTNGLSTFSDFVPLLSQSHGGAHFVKRANWGSTTTKHLRTWSPAWMSELTKQPQGI